MYLANIKLGDDIEIQFAKIRLNIKIKIKQFWEKDALEWKSAIIW